LILEKVTIEVRCFQWFDDYDWLAVYINF